ncbi:hypothetical protein [Saccharopolyspora cebuensis]|uniref:Uncharacterized protein n=1 Tax=Saccharopolyspora cebuensis TaxID=418759 RepID=A0ABV4CJ01_9PSEU
MNSTLDYLRGFTAPRAVLVGALFTVAVLARIPAVVLALGVHVLDRAAERLLGWIACIPPVPVRTVTGPTGRRTRGRTR